MPDNNSRRGAVDMGMLLMIAAFAIMGGFMFWIKGEAADERASRVVVEVPEEQTDSGIPDVRLGDIQAGADPEAFVGQVIRGVGYEVASMLGTQGFWVGTPSGNPFLVTWSDELMAEGASVAQGDVVTVEGEIKRMEMTAIDTWAAGGTITENDRIVAEFATHYLEAQRVDVTRPAGGAEEGN
jgi:hypothetical protein